MNITQFEKAYEKLKEATEAATVAQEAGIKAKDPKAIKLADENLAMARVDFKESLENEYVEVPERNGKLLFGPEYECLKKLAEDNGVKLEDLLSKITIEDGRVVKAAFYEKDLTDISALAGLTSLTELFLFENKIKDIRALSKLTSLTVLWLDDNEIEDVSPLSDLTSLTKLYITNNKIKDISALSALTALTVVNLSDNQIEDISPLSRLTALVKLYLQENKIEDISALNSLTKLKQLYLRLNPLIQDSTFDTIVDNLESRGCKVETI